MGLMIQRRRSARSRCLTVEAEQLRTRDDRRPPLVPYALCRRRTLAETLVPSFFIVSDLRRNPDTVLRQLRKRWAAGQVLWLERQLMALSTY